MKRKDIQAGQDYLVDDSNKWDSWTFGSRRVRIIDTVAVAAPSSGFMVNARNQITLSDGSTIVASARVPGNGWRGDGLLGVGVDAAGRVQAGTPFYVANRTIRATWEDGLKLRREVEARKKRESSERIKAVEDYRERYARALEALPEDAKRQMPQPSTIWSERPIWVPLAALEAIAEGLKNAR